MEQPPLASDQREAAQIPAGMTHTRTGNPWKAKITEPRLRTLCLEHDRVRLIRSCSSNLLMQSAIHAFRRTRLKRSRSKPRNTTMGG
jgi:hypothetical protein